ncbi:MAG: alpha/beta hydrolase, partial [Alphaproteobacteria bacterium CG_4_9_14_3_um_filter_47_13]
NYESIGVRDTVDLHEEFLNSNTKLFQKRQQNHNSTKKKTA